MLVLADANLRKLYDELGPEAVKISWVLGPYTGQYSEKERIKDTLRHNDEKKLMALEAKAAVQSGLDITTWFDDYSALGPLSWHDYIPSLTSMALAQSFETHITPETPVDLSFNLNAENGVGSGSARVSLAHQLRPDIRADTFLSFGSERALSLGITRFFSQNSLLSGRGIFQLNDGVLLPVLQGTYTRMLPFGVHAAGTVVAGAQNMLVLSTSWRSEEDQSNSKVTLQLSPGHTVIKYRTNYAISNTLSAGMKLTMAPQNKSLVAIGIDRVWSPQYQTGAYIECGHEDGVRLLLSLVRSSDFKFTLPIKLSHELSPSSIFIGSAVPAVAGFLLERYIVQPLQRYMEEREAAFDAVEMAQKLEQRQTEALLVADILSSAYEKRVQIEKQANGLIIEKAAYSGSSEQSLNVIVPLQMLVVDSQLLIEGGLSKANLLGFYDVAPKKLKTLKVDYTFKGRRHEAEFGDTERVVIPQRSHIIS